MQYTKRAYLCNARRHGTRLLRINIIPKGLWQFDDSHNLLRALMLRHIRKTLA
jgi:hypothetical protein